MTSDNVALPPADLIGKILSPALRFWLRSQVTALQSLDLSIQGQNRQILRGYIPLIKLQSQGAVYQGLRLSFADLTAANIRINIGQVLKGKSLQLLAPVPIEGRILITQRDLQASLTAPLLAAALQAVLTQVQPTMGFSLAACPSPQWQQVQFGANSIHLLGTVAPGSRPLRLGGSLSLLNPHTLCLDPLTLQWAECVYPLDPLTLDLGDQVEFAAVAIAPEHLSLMGKITVIPA